MQNHIVTQPSGPAARDQPVGDVDGVQRLAVGFGEDEAGVGPGFAGGGLFGLLVSAVDGRLLTGAVQEISLIRPQT